MLRDTAKAKPLATSTTAGLQSVCDQSLGQLTAAAEHATALDSSLLQMGKSGGQQPGYRPACKKSGQQPAQSSLPAYLCVPPPNVTGA